VQTDPCLSLLILGILLWQVCVCVCGGRDDRTMRIPEKEVGGEASFSAAHNPSFVPVFATYKDYQKDLLFLKDKPWLILVPIYRWKN